MTQNKHVRFLSMPFDSAPYDVLPVVYGEWEGINVAFKTKPELVRQLVPHPLKPDASSWGSDQGDVVLITQCNYQVVAPTRFEYRNSCVMIPSTLDGRLGLYFVRVFEDADDPTLLTIWGRETLGMPKLAGSTTVTLDGQRANSSLRAKDGSGIDISLLLNGAQERVDACTFTIYCRKTIPSCSDPSTPDIDRLIDIPWRQTTETRLMACIHDFNAWLVVRGEQASLPLLDVVHAFWNSHPEGTVLDFGKVIHDFHAAELTDEREPG